MVLRTKYSISIDQQGTLYIYLPGGLIDVDLEKYDVLVHLHVYVYIYYGVRPIIIIMTLGLQFLHSHLYIHTYMELFKGIIFIRFVARFSDSHR